jgi:hypothetical protein
MQFRLSQSCSEALSFLLDVPEQVVVERMATASERPVAVRAENACSR